MLKTLTRAAGALAAGVLLAHSALANEGQIRKNLNDRLPNFPPIDEVSKTPVPGLFEVRVGTEVFYTDANGDHVIQGSMIDTKTRTNLTEARVNKLTAIDFSALPLKDAVMWKNGNGSRKVVVFADPNCGYCKRFERDLQQIKDVTVYTFLFPILGQDSVDKSNNIWCAKDPSKAWLGWMLESKQPQRAASNCDTSAIERNVALGRKHRVTGTPAVVFVDGTRIPGAMNAEQIEKQLVASAAAAKAGKK